MHCSPGKTDRVHCPSYNRLWVWIEDIPIFTANQDFIQHVNPMSVSCGENLGTVDNEGGE